MVYVALLLGATAGCDTGQEPDLATGRPGGNGSVAASAQTDLTKYAQCMRAEGVQLDDPSPDGSLRVPAELEQSAGYRAAYEKCRKLLPAAPVPDTQQPAAKEKLAEFAQCMRTNGVTAYPDPSGGDNSAAYLKAQEDPDYKKAYEACTDIIGRPSPGSGGG
ncbi:hypothetical protein [Phytohabitans rumicis]|uniref:hypothetical protein n=1 Tax=Phytohabitans rumicis TaxID=1076125 RepID=UPI00156689ED|nr:hypothetical protein [Phytohabitans rumicis]